MRRSLVHAVPALLLALASFAPASVAGATAAPAPRDPVVPGVVTAPADPARAARPADRTAAVPLEELSLAHEELRRATRARLEELGRRAAAARDPGTRQALRQEGVRLKLDLERRHLELGLEIALRNGDERRAAEFGDALRALHDPESSWPAHAPDPGLRARRLRELGIVDVAAPDRSHP
jgi:hypothetical protein